MPMRMKKPNIDMPMSMPTEMRAPVESRAAASDEVHDDDGDGVAGGDGAVQRPR